MTPEEAVGSYLRRSHRIGSEAALAVAVSGGGDSMALLHLVARQGGQHGRRIHAVTVDHGLRSGSDAEAGAVARACARIGVPHSTLRWEGWDGRGNLQQAARLARRDLIADWAAELDIFDVLLGHTADDQAETVLMHLTRGSGVDGLVGMEDWTWIGGIGWHRPLLPIPRTALRAWLRAEGIGWAEDPSNDDPRFDRVRTRALMAPLAELGLTRDRLMRTADHMARARTTLRQAAQAFAERHARVDRGDLLLDPQVFDIAAGDSPGRVLSAALCWVARDWRRVRYASLLQLADQVRSGRAATLHGCFAIPEAGRVRLTRELRAVAGLSRPVPREPAVIWWDRRWLLAPPPGSERAGLRVAALGEEGLSLCPDWRLAGLPRRSMLATPAVWRGDELVAAPVAGRAQGWTAEVVSKFPGFSFHDG